MAQTGRRWPLVFAVLCGLTGLGFLLLPGSIEGKSLAALHGLCAQQPTHSFYFGGERLPFDARMTGIYGGFAMAALYMLARGRWRYGNVPSIAVSALLASFILVMGIDGINSTLRDMGVWYAYEPQNELRLATGMLTGTALAVFIWMMTAQVGFSNRGRIRQSPITGLRDLGLLMAIETGMAALILTGWSLLRLPLTFVLLVAAVAVVTGLTLAFVLLLGRRESRAATTAELAGPATIALLVALLLIGGLGGGRFLLEWWLGIEPVVRSAA
ncbi:MAG TPA: DUF2085 domain-containing protein [Thermomicrobiales bacterium]|nr:DUF2085 domain-containing protein [Thermomicrobiales bacterium]